MICIKFDQKIKKKPKFWTFEVFTFLKKPKKPRFFFEAIFQPFMLSVLKWRIIIIIIITIIVYYAKWRTNTLRAKLANTSRVETWGQGPGPLESS